MAELTLTDQDKFVSGVLARPDTSGKVSEAAQTAVTGFNWEPQPLSADLIRKLDTADTDNFTTIKKAVAVIHPIEEGKYFVAKGSNIAPGMSEVVVNEINYYLADVNFESPAQLIVKEVSAKLGIANPALIEPLVLSCLEGLNMPDAVSKGLNSNKFIQSASGNIKILNENGERELNKAYDAAKSSADQKNGEHWRSVHHPKFEVPSSRIKTNSLEAKLLLISQQKGLSQAIANSIAGVFGVEQHAVEVQKSADMSHMIGLLDQALAEDLSAEQFGEMIAAESPEVADLLQRVVDAKGRMFENGREDATKFFLNAIDYAALHGFDNMQGVLREQGISAELASVIEMRLKKLTDAQRFADKLGGAISLFEDSFGLEGVGFTTLTDYSRSVNPKREQAFDLGITETLNHILRQSRTGNQFGENLFENNLTLLRDVILGRYDMPWLAQSDGSSINKLQAGLSNVNSSIAGLASIFDFSLSTEQLYSYLPALVNLQTSFGKGQFRGGKNSPEFMRDTLEVLCSADLESLTTRRFNELVEGGDFAVDPDADEFIPKLLKGGWSIAKENTPAFYSIPYARGNLSLFEIERNGEHYVLITNTIEKTEELALVVKIKSDDIDQAGNFDRRKVWLQNNAKVLVKSLNKLKQ